ncbi:MAG: hypothetical protein F4078_00005 [Acidimicrobiia bacterium]|nr:hypothetical protein [Acidimicrobiia bacterium]
MHGAAQLAGRPVRLRRAGGHRVRHRLPPAGGPRPDARAARRGRHRRHDRRRGHDRNRRRRRRGHDRRRRPHGRRHGRHGPASVSGLVERRPAGSGCPPSPARRALRDMPPPGGGLRVASRLPCPYGAR